MKKLSAKLLSLLLAGLMVLSCFVACGDTDVEGDDTVEQGATEAGTEAETEDALQAALNEIGDVDYGGKEFGVLYEESFKGEIYGEKGNVGADGEGEDQTINDAVYERNILFEERCKLTFSPIASSAQTITTDVQKAAMGGDSNIVLIDATLANSAKFSVDGYLYNYLDLGVDIDRKWWDAGTADFELDGRVYFMSGDVNFGDDNMTYVLLFNKKMREEYAATVPNPYDTVLNWEWTLDYFNTVIQGVSADNGDGQWDEKDKYGFVTTYEFGNTFFIGSDLRYIVNDAETGLPTLFLAEQSKMEKAQNVLSLGRKIYHENNATYMSPAGSEQLGLAAFKENRGLFYSEIASYLKEVNRTSDTDFGVLPVPKYDKEQEFYRTWTYPGGSALSIASTVTDAETVGKIVEIYAILSSQKVKPAFYDITLTSKNIKDPQSKQMLDIIFQNRVYDMALYYQSIFGDYFSKFRDATYKKETTNFQSGYTSVAKQFDRKLKSFQNKLDKIGKDAK